MVERGTPTQMAGRWAERARKATAQRDFWIGEMRAEGATLRAIAEVVGMTAPGVQRVLNRS